MESGPIAVASPSMITSNGLLDIRVSAAFTMAETLNGVRSSSSPPQSPRRFRPLSCSSHRSRNARFCPYASSPVNQANGTFASTARVPS